jgi:hypothetical protein
MWGFVFGVLVGVVGKVVYDLFKEEPLPASMSVNTGRLEALLDETRQTMRELREEVRQALSGEGTVQEKASRVASAAAETVKSKTSEDKAGQERLTVTGADVGSASDTPSTPPAGPSSTQRNPEAS